MTFTLSLILCFQNPRKRQVISFVTERAKYTKLANKANFMGRKIISENCVLVKNKQTKICFDKPLFVGNNFVNRVGQRRNIYKKRGKTKNFALSRSQVSKFSITPKDFCSISSIFIFILWPSRMGFYYAFYTGTRKNARRRLKRRNETKTFLFTIFLPLSAIRIRFSPW